jgi:hypothetical protein
MPASQTTTDEEKGRPSITSAGSHPEKHASNSEYLESAVLGMADGLTVPFALTAGLSSYVFHLPDLNRS